MEKIGIFGGSFNPIHLGHLIFAQEALHQYQLDKIIFIPTSNPPHKDPAELIGGHHRLKMVELAIHENSRFEVSDVELKREGKSYTIDTLEALQKEKNGNAEFFLLVGMDMLSEIFTWKEAEKLINLCWFLGAPRHGYSWELLDDRMKRRVKLVEMPIIDIAARTIRYRIRNNQPVRYWVPESVYHYLYHNELYLDSMGSTQNNANNIGVNK